MDRALVPRALSLGAALALLVSCAGGVGSAQQAAPGVPVPPALTGTISATSEWRAISRVGAPLYGNEGYRMFWTGRGLVVIRHDGGGGVYDPYNDSWRVLSPRQGGGSSGPTFVADGSVLFTGEATNPVTPRAVDAASAAWRSIPEAPDHIGAFAARAWTGSKLFVWGGVVPRSPPAPSGSPYEDTGLGAILDVATGAWRPIFREGAPTARAKAVAAWTGSVFFVWGGASNTNGAGSLCPHSYPQFEKDCVYRPNGALYDPVKERWRALPSEGAPPRFVVPAILWSGRVVLLWDEAASSPQAQMYAYDPQTNRWLAPLVMPRAYPGEAAGVSGGRVVFLDQAGGAALDVDKKVFSPITIPDDIRGCSPLRVEAFEPSRVIVLSPAFCHKGTIAVSAFDPRANTWKTEDLPPVPRPGAVPGAPKGFFSGLLAWTGEHVIAWGGAYPMVGSWQNGCENPPPGVGCDPVAAPTKPTDEAFVIKPSL